MCGRKVPEHRGGSAERAGSGDWNRFLRFAGLGRHAATAGRYETAGLLATGSASATAPLEAALTSLASAVGAASCGSLDDLWSAGAEASAADVSGWGWMCSGILRAVST